MSQKIRLTWNSLRRRLVAVTETREAKLALAKEFGVSLAAVSQWRSGAHAPTADTALGILSWVEEFERKTKKETPGRESPQPSAKTLRKPTHTYEGKPRSKGKSKH